jgi:hypothetical protein
VTSEPGWLHAAHLQFNKTAANNDHLSWYVLERERASRDDNLLFICFDGTVGEWCNLEPGGDDLNGTLRFCGLAALVELRQIVSGGTEGPIHSKGGVSLDVVDLVLLEENLDALSEILRSEEG